MKLLLPLLIINSLTFLKSPVRASATKEYELDDSEGDDSMCEPGLILPVWQSHVVLSVGDRIARGLICFLATIYMLLGLYIISNRFFTSVKVITSTEKEIKVKRQNEVEKIVIVRVWNVTFATAPHLLLAIVEIFSSKFVSGDLGPGSIVGSAAFNLLVITAVCVYVIPDGEVRKIKNLRVFAVMAIWSIFAYLWMFLILKVFSPGVVEIWEGVVTVLFLPALLITVYIAFRTLHKNICHNKWCRINKKKTDGGTSEKEIKDASAGQLAKTHENRLTTYIVPNVLASQLIEVDAEASIGLSLHTRTQFDEDNETEIELLPKADREDFTQNCMNQSKDFQTTMKTSDTVAKSATLVETSSWKYQFIEAISLDKSKVPSCGDYVMHFLTLLWKIAFAFVPPNNIAGGYAAYVVAILIICGLTTLTRDLVSLLGCTVGLKFYPAFSFVAVGTGIPGIFISKAAAIQNEYADAAFGYLAGVNAIYIFLCIGIPWSLASFNHKFMKPIHTTCVKCGEFHVDPGSLAYSVTVLGSLALVATFVLVLRRHKSIGGELGGPRKAKEITTGFFFCLWLVYLLMTSLEAYGIVQGF